MFMLSWNFWEWGKTQYRVGNARSREMQVNYALANIRDQISLEVKNAWLNLRQAEKQISVARKAIDEAEESFLISLERYRESTVTTTTVLDAQTRLTKANSDYYNALGDYHIGLAKLERAMGNLSPENRTGE
jgi:outer membrane protein TolC